MSASPTGFPRAPGDLDEPSADDFALMFSDEAPARSVSPLGRVVRGLGVTLLIAAMLLYFVRPLDTFIVGTVRHWQVPGTGIQLIPPAPKHESAPSQLS
jgi:hypothetical protein